MKSDSANKLSGTVVDLFCGAGGLSYGFLKQGFKIAAGIDVDHSCKFAYEANNGAEFVEKDVEKISPDEILGFYGDDQIKILAGCAPCQPFSTYTQGKESGDESRWQLLKSFARIATAVRPDIITMENVPQLKKHDVFDGFVRSLKQGGYHVNHHIVYCPDYGIPQTRTRLVLLASLFGEIQILKPTHTPDSYVTVKEAIGNLEPIKAGCASQKDRLHKSSDLSDQNLKRIRASLPGGTWRDWETDLRASCHRKKKGKTYPGVYGRMSWNQPSPTITTQFYGFGNGRFGHPKQHRALSLREGAILQTFPKNYRFIQPHQEVHVKTIGRLIGNAVPVKLGEVIAKSIKAHLRQHAQ